LHFQSEREKNEKLIFPFATKTMSLVISENPLTYEDVLSVMLNPSIQVSYSSEVLEKITLAHDFIQQKVDEKAVVYGVTTGFGSMKDVPIPMDKVHQLQLNLIRSHAIGAGNPVPLYIVRGMLLLRATCIAQGHSGVSVKNANILLDALNKNVIPYVPEQGTVGASGDLSPLSFMILALIGEGQAWNPSTSKFEPSAEVMKQFNIDTIQMKAKEGLALNNGTQFMTSNLIYALYIALKALAAANLGVALTTEMLHGTSKALDHRVHEARGQIGQIETAEEIAHYVNPPSERAVKYAQKLVQEAYSLRCAPQVHGPVKETLSFVRSILEKEINSANDNPLIFVEKVPIDDGYALEGTVISGGNFHGQYLATAADYLGIAMSTLTNVSERRLERLINSSLDNRNPGGKKHIPSFAVEDAGLNSGLMILQYMAAGIAAENRQLANPGSVHSIPTCENSEDFVSMGGWACRKAVIMATNASKVIACEIYAGKMSSFFASEKTTESLERVLASMNFEKFIVDRHYQNEYDKVLEMVLNGKLIEVSQETDISMHGHRALF
jgi:histidine ammonia-lyase